jgi:hypothetical protein
MYNVDDIPELKEAKISKKEQDFLELKERFTESKRRLDAKIDAKGNPLNEYQIAKLTDIVEQQIEKLNKYKNGKS